MPTPSHYRKPTAKEAADHLVSLNFKASRMDAWKYFDTKFGGDFSNLVKKELKKSKKGEALLLEMGALAELKAAHG